MALISKERHCRFAWPYAPEMLANNLNMVIKDIDLRYLRKLTSRQLSKFSTKHCEFTSWKNISYYNSMFLYVHIYHNKTLLSNEHVRNWKSVQCFRRRVLIRKVFIYRWYERRQVVRVSNHSLFFFGNILWTNSDETFKTVFCYIDVCLRLHCMSLCHSQGYPKIH